RVPPVAPPREPHRLPGRAGFGKLHQSRSAALRVVADRLRLLLRACPLRPEEILGERRCRGNGRQGKKAEKYQASNPVTDRSSYGTFALGFHPHHKDKPDQEEPHERRDTEPGASG